MASFLFDSGILVIKKSNSTTCIAMLMDLENVMGSSERKNTMCRRAGERGIGR